MPVIYTPIFFFSPCSENIPAAGSCCLFAAGQNTKFNTIFTTTFAFFSVDKFGMERYLYEGQCVAACPEAFYHTKERSCERCSAHCRLCTSPAHCLKCNSSYYVSDGSCAKLECGEGKQGQHDLYHLLFKGPRSFDFQTFFSALHS